MESSESHMILVIGAPGAGKGTLCQKLARDHGLGHVSVGDVLRQAVRKPDADPAVVDYVQRSELLPCETLFSVLRAHLAPPKQDGPPSPGLVLLDGFPRRLDQAEQFARLFGHPRLVLFFDCPEHLAETRVVGRQQGRAGDNLATFRKRYAEYAALNPPIVDYYEGKNKLVVIDTSSSTDASYAQLQAALQLRSEWPF